MGKKEAIGTMSVGLNNFTETNGAVPVVSVRGLSKCYTRTEQRTSLRYEGIRVLKQIFMAAQPDKGEPFYALKDVSFDVAKGEGVAIIGRNGSGKTTLLRLLAGITAPTTGEIKVVGRFATLIGLATGFNTELTGRENIYLNATIQGVPPKQLEPIVDDIIEFAELGEWIDTRVTRYSSGMFARLGFSIMIHILPEVIFADEALSVGDSAFQQKCLQRLKMLRDEKRTIVAVGHSPGLLRMLCDRAVWLDRGQIIMDGEFETVMEAYQSGTGVKSLVQN